jgi:hypothetical protein
VPDDNRGTYVSDLQPYTELARTEMLWERLPHVPGIACARTEAWARVRVFDQHLGIVSFSKQTAPMLT